ncbi:MAG TPA: endonuclease/exonuclease/phosphatase family protein [Gemmatimonadaceae bacterium]|nr:endonuclease/exonuclease/phosphatase family protein [Gemmatimonadaceae bacterium]
MRTSLRIRRSMNASATFGPVALVALLASCAWRTGGREAAPATVTLRAMTYNIQSGHGNLDGTIAAIRDAKPDIVGLQEVDVHWGERSGFVDQAAALGERLGMAVRFAHIYSIPVQDTSLPPREFGVALLSRLPIVAWRNDTLTRLSTQDSTPVPAPAPGLLDATVDVRGTRVRVFSTHLDYRADPRVRQRQVAEMLGYIGRPSVPTILLGDLNAEPHAPELAPLLAVLHDSWLPAFGPGLTYPADVPRKRIDYVLVSLQFHVDATVVPAIEASDHRPVIVDLSLAPATAR